MGAGGWRGLAAERTGARAAPCASCRCRACGNRAATCPGMAHTCGRAACGPQCAPAVCPQGAPQGVPSTYAPQVRPYVHCGIGTTCLAERAQEEASPEHATMSKTYVAHRVRREVLVLSRAFASCRVDLGQCVGSSQLKCCWVPSLGTCLLCRPTVQRNPRD